MVTVTNTTKNNSSFSNITKNISSISNGIKTLYNQYLLMEDGAYLLMEDGYKILIEDNVEQSPLYNNLIKS